MGMVGRSDRKSDYDFDFRDLEGFAYCDGGDGFLSI